MILQGLRPDLFDFRAPSQEALTGQWLCGDEVPESGRESPVSSTSHPLSIRDPRPLTVPQFLHLQNKGTDFDHLNSEIPDTLLKMETRRIQLQPTEAPGGF